jgi:hypothetical protein
MTAVRLVLAMAISAPTTPTARDAGPAAAPSPMPTDAQCHALGPSLKSLPFGPGETLEFDVDALGAKAGSMVMRVLPFRSNGRMAIEVAVETNTFFSKVRRVKGTGTSTMDPRTLRPIRYIEDATENEVQRVADVTFGKSRTGKVVVTTRGAVSSEDLRWGGGDITDVASAVFLLRSVPLAQGQSLCFDAYAIRKIWRVWGTVLPREHASLPVGEFEAWHLAGTAARLDRPDIRREVHVWVSDDARRLPLAALGSIDLGAVRATLRAFQRPGERGTRAENRGNLTW